MSFNGEYGTLAKQMPANALAVVLEISLNEATWDPDSNGTLTSAFLVSDKTVSARGQAYDPCVIKGGWSGIRQTIELRASGLSGLATSVTVADPDNRVRNMLVNGNNRNSPAVIFRLVPGSPDDYDTRFTGLLDSWEFSRDQVKLNLKTDERNLRANFPAWPYLKSEWFHMDPEFDRKYIPIVYGKHDSTALNLDHGMVPTTAIWLDAANSWHGTNIAPASYIKDVYVSDSSTTVKAVWNGPEVPGNEYEKFYGLLAGAKIFTAAVFNNLPSTDKTITADLYGYSLVNEVLFTGGNVITNPVTQLRHFLVNFAVDRTRGYIPSAWNMTSTLIETNSWDLCATWADNHGLEGSRYMDDQKTALSRITEWCESFPPLKPFWNTDGQIELRILSTEWPGYWDGVTNLVTREDTIGKEFKYALDPMEVTGKVSIQYCRDSVANKFLRSLDLQDLQAAELEDTKLAMYWSPARQA